MPALHALLFAVQDATAGITTHEMDRLTFSDVLENLPTDPASIFVLALLLASVAGILWTGRPRRPGAPGGTP